jgi:hypothetical protein
MSIRKSQRAQSTRTIQIPASNVANDQAKRSTVIIVKLLDDVVYVLVQDGMLNYSCREVA